LKRYVRDADTVARTLFDSGFTPICWRDILRDDPKNSEDPFVMDAAPMCKTTERANNAFAVNVVNWLKRHAR